MNARSTVCAVCDVQVDYPFSPNLFVWCGSCFDKHLPKIQPTFRSNEIEYRRYTDFVWWNKTDSPTHKHYLMSQLMNDFLCPQCGRAHP